MYTPDLTRRNFFKAAAVGAGAIALSSLPSLASAQDVVPGKPFTPGKTQPFASFPFKTRDSLGLNITNGWTLSTDEEYVLGGSVEGDHAAVDFEGVPYGADVLALSDGYVLQAAQIFYMNYEKRFDPANPKQLNRMWKDPFSGKEGYLGGGGIFVELQTDYFIPGVGFICAQYFHIGAIEAFVPRVETLYRGADDDYVTIADGTLKGWYPKGILKSQDAFRSESARLGGRVKMGQKIATVGDVGINFGYQDAYDPATNTVAPRDRKKLTHWDPQGAGAGGLYGTDPLVGQTHVQFYAGRRPDLSKILEFDSFDLQAKITSRGGFIKGKYGQIPDMRLANNPYNPIRGVFGYGPKTIWKHTPSGSRIGLPSFAG